MNIEMMQAATEAAARVVSPLRLYRTRVKKSTIINEIMARLLFAMESPHLSPVERTGVLSVVDQLVRLKIDHGLLKGVAHGY
jgi:hypothetical protein